MKNGYENKNYVLVIGPKKGKNNMGRKCIYTQTSVT